VLGHAADPYHRMDIRRTCRHLEAHHRDRVVADTTRPLVLYESGFSPRWYVTRADLDESALTPVEQQTFCPYKGMCTDYDIGDARRAAWSYRHAYDEVGRISDFVTFEPDMVSVRIGGVPLRIEPGQTVMRPRPGSRRRRSAPSHAAMRTARQRRAASLAARMSARSIVVAVNAQLLRRVNL
jgi:uncharacterized protein (DUF427 family)